MLISETGLPGVTLIRPVRHRDARGFFAEIFREDIFADHGIGVRFVQENYSLSERANVIRGLHFQIPPAAQAKLVRVVSGAILDVAVDLRWGSPHYGRSIAIVLTALTEDQLYIPEGFAHGFRTLEPNTGVQYRVNRYYSSEHDRGVLWNDPQLGIDWQLEGAEPLLSERDQRHPVLGELPRFFSYQQPPGSCG
jgi:dTDP-4-dehydrorhamnose 3,5-epimerase